MSISKDTFEILLDCSKAFYTIDHLTRKLHKLSFPVQALKLIHSYVPGRKQFDQVDGESSFFKLWCATG